MMFRRLIIAVLAASVATLLCCTKNVAGGGGTEWEAKVSGYTVYDGSGIPAAGARVTLSPEYFLKDTANGQALRQTVTDKDGFFVFDGLEPGAFHIEVNDGKSWASLTKCEIVQDDTGIAIACTLKPTSRISGTIAIPAGYRGSAYVQVYGLDRVARAAPDGAFTLNDIPQGDYTLRILPTNGDYKPGDVGAVAVATGVEIRLGTLSVPLNDSAWSCKRTFHLNTSASGANVRSDVLNFPVLLRLTAGNFNFLQAKADGADLRFTKADGSVLRYEIERWDPVAGFAEVWVKVDTVRGNDSMQSLVMYWGKENAVAQSNGAAVFDTTNGFQGVWHLAAAGSGNENDATGNHYDGTPSDTAPAAAEGTIGPCKSFNGLSHHIRMNGTADSKLNFQVNGTYTISAWAYVDTLDNASHLIIGKGNEQYYLKFKSSIPEDTSMVWEFVEYHDKTGWFITNSLPAVPSAKTWVHITGVRKGAAQLFYVNGEPVDSTVSITSATLSRQTDDDVTIGEFSAIPPDSMEGLCAFLGKIDEVRISNTAYSADWIKLCYMNQKSRDALLNRQMD